MKIPRDTFIYLLINPFLISSASRSKGKVQCKLRVVRSRYKERLTPIWDSTDWPSTVALLLYTQLFPLALCTKQCGWEAMERQAYVPVNGTSVSIDFVEKSNFKITNQGTEITANFPLLLLSADRRPSIRKALAPRTSLHFYK